MTRFILMFAMLAVATGALAAPAGQVIYAFGDARAEDASGNSRRLVRGVDISSGDTLVTGEGRLQVRFSDGGHVALQPRTRYAVEDYHFTDGQEDGERNYMSLLRGSVRFVTGLIGKANRAAYRIRTPVATIGIRGSGGRADMCVDGSCGERQDGLYLTGNDDVLTLSNDLSDREVRPGDTFYVQCPNCAIVAVDVGPVAHQDLALPAADRRFEFGEQREDGETLAAIDVPLFPDDVDEEPRVPSEPPVIPPEPPVTPSIIPLVTGPGSNAITFVGDNDNLRGGLVGGTNTFNVAGALTQFRDGTFTTEGFDATSVAYFDADGIVAWGLWDGGTTTPGQAALLGTSNLAAASYVASLSTTNVPAATLATINGTYTVFGSTPPVAVSGGSVAAIGTADSVTGAFNVNFGANTVGYNLAVPLSGQTFTLSGTATFVNPSPLAGDSRILGGGSITSSGAGCTPSCTGSVPFGPDIQAFISGTSGERLGGNYGFTSAIGSITGAVVAKP